MKFILLFLKPIFFRKPSTHFSDALSAGISDTFKEMGYRVQKKKKKEGL